MTAKAPEATRRKILEAAFAEIYRHGFQGASINRIMESAGTTKGAMFHHFEGKHELGYAVIDELIGPLLEQRWIEPMRHDTNPLSELKRAFRRYITEDIESGSYVQGCPLNNLAQEMSPLDDGFHHRIDGLYRRWRAAIEEALERGIDQGTVDDRISPGQVASLIVAAQMGIWGSAKSARSDALMRLSGEALCHYLDSLKR